MGNTNSTIDTISIPYLKHDKLNNRKINRDKINNYVVYAFNNYLDEDSDENQCIIIPRNNGLTPQELKIAEGIMLANGIGFYETDKEF